MYKCSTLESKQPNLKLKTRHQYLLGFVQKDITFPNFANVETGEQKKCHFVDPSAEATTFGKMTRGKMAFRIMTLGITTLGLMTYGGMAHGKMTWQNDMAK
jgi:hypothetical protein